ncbi:hypothetical protein T01_10366 [Trichinella spiralis]|uniref:Uncharacterized protein n=1 Tax=Trichinella spiralis TaxID=6334 RepID=A0A0V1BFZ8_TRISP|nr:hypothetical protein T01_10366 [Trichinella spiralis]
MPDFCCSAICEFILLFVLKGNVYNKMFTISAVQINYISENLTFNSEDSSVPIKAGTDIVLADHVLPGFLKRELSELFLHFIFMAFDRYLSDAEYKQCATHFKMSKSIHSSCDAFHLHFKSSHSIQHCVYHLYEYDHIWTGIMKSNRRRCSIRGTVAALLLLYKVLHIARITSKQSKRIGIAVHSAAMVADVTVQMIKSGMTTISKY